MRENHYAIPCIKSKISQVSNYKISITLLILPICRGSVLTFPTAKLTKILENEGVTEKENQSNILRNEKDWLPLHRNI